METEETVIASSWLLRASLSTRTTCVCERDGVWSVIFDGGPAATSRSLDEALVTALRAPAPPVESPRSG
jgi:hypothetical protein